MGALAMAFKVAAMGGDHLDLVIIKILSLYFSDGDGGLRWALVKTCRR